MTVSFKEYEDAKREIIGGVEYKRNTQYPYQWGVLTKYITKENGYFFEETDLRTGVTEFWSMGHPSRYYAGSYNEAIKEYYEEAIASLKKENAQLFREKMTYQKGMNENADMIAALSKENMRLKKKLENIKAIVEVVA